MAEIPTTFGAGGAGLTTRGGTGDPSLADVLRDVATDLQSLVGDGPDALTDPDDPPAVTQGAATPLTAFTDGPTAPEMANLVTQFNALNTRVTQVLARLDAAFTALGTIGDATGNLHALQTARSGLNLLTSAP